MTAVLTRGVPHFDVTPADVIGLCLLCGCTANVMDVFDDNGRPVALWSGDGCSSEYTTLFTPRPCPDRVPWCVLHDRGVDGHDWHRTLTSAVRPERDGHLGTVDEDAFAVRGVLVNDDRGRLPLVWIVEAYPEPSFPIADGVGLSPARARQFGMRLIELANQIEGGEPR